MNMFYVVYWDNEGDESQVRLQSFQSYGEAYSFAIDYDNYIILQGCVLSLFVDEPFAF